MTKRTTRFEPKLPQNDREAIEFALHYIDPFDIPNFLLDWLDGRPLQPYLDEVIRKQQRK